LVLLASLGAGGELLPPWQGRRSAFRVSTIFVYSCRAGSRWCGEPIVQSATSGSWEHSHCNLIIELYHHHICKASNIIWGRFPKTSLPCCWLDMQWQSLTCWALIIMPPPQKCTKWCGGRRAVVVQLCKIFEYLSLTPAIYFVWVGLPNQNIFGALKNIPSTIIFRPWPKWQGSQHG
jgi:hypothetical protein